MLFRMKNVLLLTFALPLALSLALSLAACSGDTAPVSEGESHVRLRLTGGTLEAPLEIEGATEGLSFYAYSEINMLGFAKIKSADGQYEVANMTLTVDTPSAGIYTAEDFDFHISGFVNAAGETVGYSLRPRGGEGTIEIVEVEAGERLHVKIDSAVSPTQNNAKDLVFHLEGEIVIRD